MYILFAFAILFLVSRYLNNIHAPEYFYETYKGQKKLKLWFPKWIFLSIVIFFTAIFLVALYQLLVITYQSDYPLPTILSISGIILPSIFYYLTYDTKIASYWTTDTIQNIDKNGFEIHTYKDSKLKKIRKVRWIRVKRLKLTYNLDLLLESGEWINLDTKTEHYHNLLRELPNYLPNISRIQVNAKFKRLKSCPICGSIAVDYKTCKACGTKVWNSNFKKHYRNPQDYIRKKQLDLFASLHKNSLQKIAFSNNDTFELDKNWQPIVTQKEIIKQSKKLFWVL